MYAVAISCVPLDIRMSFARTVMAEATLNKSGNDVVSHHHRPLCGK